MIKSFKSRALKRFWWNGESSAVDSRHVQKLRRVLGLLDVAAAPDAMNVPGWRFHRLKGRDVGRYAVWVDQNWRLTFAWSEDGPDAVDVDYLDYH